MTAAQRNRCDVTAARYVSNQTMSLDLVWLRSHSWLFLKLRQSLLQSEEKISCDRFNVLCNWENLSSETHTWDKTWGGVKTADGRQKRVSLSLFHPHHLSSTAQEGFAPPPHPLHPHKGFRVTPRREHLFPPVNLFMFTSASAARPLVNI